jgi:DNA helicase HerA-like ATPase
MSNPIQPSQPILGHRDGTPNQSVSILIPELMESRLLVTGNSGAGKSRALRRIIEQVYGQVQLIILDPEEEFYTLREKLDFILAGPGGDCPAVVSTADKLASKLLELHASAVIGMGDMKLDERMEFVALFYERLMLVPRTERRRVVLILDEADIYVPEGPTTPCKAVVIDVCIRGRKRGFCPILATQRPALLIGHRPGHVCHQAGRAPVSRYRRRPLR